MKISTILVAGAVTAGLVFAVQANNGRKTASASTAYAAPTSLGAPMTRAERHELIRTIAQRWAGYVRQVRKVEPAVWGRSMGAAFASADPANLRRAAAMTTYEGMIGMLLGYNTSDAKVIDTLARDNSLAALQALASPSSDLVYNVITPCRIIDTRLQVGLQGGRLVANAARDFEVSRPGGDFVSQGGAASDCGIPADPAAVVMNVVSVAPAGPGYVTLFPYGETMPLSSTVNNLVGGDAANETVVKVTVGAAADFSAYSLVGTDLVADAVGYFSAPVATGLECVTANGTQSQVAPGATFSLTANCPTGYSVAGGGVRAPGGNPDITLAESFPQGGTSWIVSGRNTSAISDTLQARANCCRVPGR